MKRLLFLIALTSTLTVVAQKNIYESPNFDHLSEDHQVLAIIPFLTNLDLNEKVSKSEQKRLEENEGYAVQNALETYFSKRSKKKKLPVTFQNIENTAAILAKKNISYENIDVYTTKELSEILGVDGIISGTLDLNILLSNGVPTEFSFTDYFSGGANYGRIGIKISDGNTGKLLWKYEKEINKKTGKNTTDLIDRMMKLAIRKFPYERERKRDRNKS
ncbi:MAG: hypothetical protein ABJO28_05370 [Maribacter dokdonensis]|uniref:Uncharacterized protein n=1 Tax=Maribacter dokdonensis TaxID=320912 RepID=A0A1H4Q013_9FLAO|nr:MULTISPECIES: hypothetical protein [Maribacter]APA65388.1 hypothetical protein YQ22_14335 [Maribacter sp. 1_2014MBL_MicDiv]KSA14423.1 hypothetical protein I600_1017 [Maribacter dokdonensis DSW-8]MBU2901411.1 hypothetical protein [Maribacter dokdonensis]MDP2527809.1 hypothetical protein [Maribacter dokdonensis]PHN93238.1 hypothetical protein CSC80_09865 [Maribacter sp. 6B07]|tara:strand:+ start:4983 stop:5636 length:654 start_codon:yes stop_codon:yes gene_type:complete